MPYFAINLKAGIEYRQDIQGRLVLIDSIGVASGIDITLIRNGTPSATMPSRKTAFRYQSPFDGVIMKSAVDASIGIFLSNSDVQLGFSDNSAVTVPAGVRVNSTVADPVIVNFGGIVAPVLGAVEVTNLAGAPIPAYFPVTPTVNVGTMPNVTIAALPNVTIAALPNVTIAAMPDVTGAVLTAPQALTTLTTVAQATVGVAAASVSNDATLKRITFRNANTTGNIYLGGATVTAANSAIVLAPGDTFIDEMGAAADWYAIADIAASKLNLQTLK